MNAASPLLVIGYGNPLRGDDGVGPWIADQLAASLPAAEAAAPARAVSTHQLTPEFAELISHYRRVVFIDAREDLAPGDISAQWLEPPDDAAAPLTHHCDPASLVLLAERLFGHAPEVLVIGIGGQTFELGMTLSPAVSAAAERVLRQVADLGALARGETVPF